MVGAVQIGVLGAHNLESEERPLCIRITDKS
jgi:hypothetical protein